jgi:dUTP pyrophosphatase
LTRIKVKKLHTEAIVPERATPLSSGFDLCTLDVVKPNRLKTPYDPDFLLYVLCPGERVLVRTGISLEIPEGYEGQVRPRSGLALKNGITVLNSPGTIDADYRGDVGVILVNQGDETFSIHKGDRIAQLVISPVCHGETVVLIESDLTITERDEGGFGHTGK